MDDKQLKFLAEQHKRHIQQDKESFEFTKKCLKEKCKEDSLYVLLANTCEQIQAKYKLMSTLIPRISVNFSTDDLRIEIDVLVSPYDLSLLKSDFYSRTFFRKERIDESKCVEEYIKYHLESQFIQWYMPRADRFLSSMRLVKYLQRYEMLSNEERGKINERYAYGGIIFDE